MLTTYRHVYIAHRHTIHACQRLHDGQHRCKIVMTYLLVCRKGNSVRRRAVISNSRLSFSAKEMRFRPCSRIHCVFWAAVADSFEMSCSSGSQPADCPAHSAVPILENFSYAKVSCLRFSPFTFLYSIFLPISNPKQCKPPCYQQRLPCLTSTRLSCSLPCD